MRKFFLSLSDKGKKHFSQQLFFQFPLVLMPRELGIAEITPGSSYDLPALRLTKFTEMKEQKKTGPEMEILPSLYLV